MNRLELLDILDSKKIPSSQYSIKGYKDDAVCMLTTDGKFEIAYFERGVKRSYGNYQTESDACNSFLNILSGSNAV
jgi:hypothetical protein